MEIGKGLKRKNECDAFIDYCARLEPVEFYGLTRILKVEVLKEKRSDEMRPMEDIVQDMITMYLSQNRKRRREIMKILNAATENRKYYKGELDIDSSDEEV